MHRALSIRKASGRAQCPPPSPRRREADRTGEIKPPPARKSPRSRQSEKGKACYRTCCDGACNCTTRDIRYSLRCRLAEPIQQSRIDPFGLLVLNPVRGVVDFDQISGFAESQSFLRQIRKQK